MSDDKPREYFVVESHNLNGLPARIYKLEPVWLNIPYIKVIDKLAYEQALEKIKTLTAQNEVMWEQIKQTEQYLCEHIIDDCGYCPEDESKEDLVTLVRSNSSDADIHLHKLRQTITRCKELEKV